MQQNAAASRPFLLRNLALMVAVVLITGLVGLTVVLFIASLQNLRPSASAGLPDAAPLQLLPTETPTPLPPPTDTPPPLPPPADTPLPPPTDLPPEPRVEPTVVPAEPLPTLPPEPPAGSSGIPSRIPRSAVRCGVRVVHVVRPGENLFRIALRYNTTILSIAQRNRIADPRVIRAGQRLHIVTCR
jgi:hypothetical protein